MPEPSRVAVLISGRGSNMAALIYAAKISGCQYEVVLVTGDNPDAGGFLLAEAEGVPVVRRDPPAKGEKASWFDSLDDILRSHRVDYIALAGFMRILPASFVERWDGRILNIHPSLLPKYKGLETHQKAIEAGDETAGCSVHVVTAELDDGPVLAQIEVAILPGDTAETLASRVLFAEHQLYPRALGQYAGRIFDAGWIEREVDELAAQLPQVSRTTSHGSPAWKVGSEKSGKIFAIIADHHHGEEAVGLLVKSSGSDEMTGLIEAQPEVYYWPKYYGASGWLGIKLNRPDADWAQVSEWLARSWELAAPRRLLEMGGR